MKVMVLVKATQDSEAGRLPGEALLSAMGQYNDSMDEAIEWVKRCPNPMPTDSEIEIRPVFGPEDFGGEMTPVLKAQEESQRQRLASTTTG